MQVRLAESKKELRACFNLHLGIRKHKFHMLAQEPLQLLSQHLRRNLIF